MPYKIKRLAVAELEPAKQLFILLQADDGVLSPTLASDEYLINLLSKKSFYCIAAFDGVKVIGGLTAYEFPMVKAETAEVYLYEIVVDKAYRKQTLATKIIEFTKQLCISRGVSYMLVGTEPDNIAAQKLYLKTGGQPEGNLPHYAYEF
jgi:aminoglycoside 3-N-acetyltransferase I